MKIIFVKFPTDLDIHANGKSAFRLLATHFFFNSKKEVDKKMPPRKLMPLRGSLCSSPLAGSKELAEKTPLKHLLP